MGISQLDESQVRDFMPIAELGGIINQNYGNPSIFGGQTSNFVAERIADPIHHPFLENFAQIQNFTESLRLNRKGKGKHRRNAPDPNDVEPMFSGTNRDCVICIREFEHHDQVVRLVCGHVFHSECWHAYHYRSCPVCRGGARVASHYLYIVPPDEEDTPVQHAFPIMPGPVIEELHATVTHGAQVFDTSTPPQSENVDEDFESVEGSPNQMTLPWWIAPDGTKVYLSVYLPSGLSIIVDPGAYTNLTGKKWARAQAIKAKKNNQQTKQEKMRTPLGVSGVGEGSQKCTHQ